jgi:hypothetical protein
MVELRRRVRLWLRVVWPVAILIAIALAEEAGIRWN